MPARSLAAISRRGLFTLAGASAALAASPAAARNFGSGFTHGVASGEPGHGSVLLWTRYVGDVDAIEWVISKNADLSRPVRSGTAPVSAESDYCVKAQVPGGLEPDSWYYFQFVAPDGSKSEIGRTRTFPQGPSARFRMAVFSCANIGFGWFNAYAHAAEANDCDLAVHLGDYIYEYGAGTYPSPSEAHPLRSLSPSGEAFALADYRLRYASYRADPDLRRLHQVLPMIAVWDDHESANDSWENGAENHQSETEGDWAVRKAASKRAWREWMPVSDKPYAAYEIGDLATLFRLDTRLEGRERQFELSDIIGGATSPVNAARSLMAFREGKWADPQRHLLGAAQEEWLLAGLTASKARGARWQVVAQQVLMGELRTPPGLIEEIGEGVPDFVRQRLIAAAMASAAGLPANMDAWDGYPAARARVLKGALEANANLLVLAGDTHNGWGFELAQDGAHAGIEFGTPGVTSPGLERSVANIPPERFARALVEANPQLVWADTSQRGYTAIELTPSSASAEFRLLATVRDRSARLVATHRIMSQAGSRRLTS